MSAKLVVDLAKIKENGISKIRCSYKHHPQNKGFEALLEKIRFVLICRKCQAAPCVNTCPRKALEKVPVVDGQESVLKRANMLCTGCGSCAIACPFGTIYTELVPFTSSVCDLCTGRLEKGEKPLCVTTCEDNCLDYKEVKPSDDAVEVFEGVVVKVAGGVLWEPFLREKKKV